MKNVTYSEGNLVVFGDTRGSIFSSFGLIFLICVPFLWFFGTIYSFVSASLGIILILVGLITYQKKKKTKFLEIKEELLTIYPTGNQNQRYEVPLARISCFTKRHLQRSRNTEVIILCLNSKSFPPVTWINNGYNEILSKKEIEIDSLPIKERNLEQFFDLLDEKFAIKFVKLKKHS